MAVAGLRGTGDWATDERPKNFREMILWLRPNGMAPLTALMSKMKHEKTDDPEFAWWEEKLASIRVQVNGALSTSSTTVVIDSGDAEDLKKGDLLLVEPAADAAVFNEEIVMVTTVASSTQFVIVRAQGGTTAQAIPDDSWLLKIGSAHEEGDGAPEAATRNPTKVYNYCQIFKDTYQITNTAKLTRTRTGDPIKNDKKRKMFDHSVALEWAMLFGERSEGTGANGKPLRTTRGLRRTISTNVTVFSTTPTVETFLDAVYPVFDYTDTDAGDERIVFAGNGALNTLNQLIESNGSTRVNYSGTIKQWGMNLQKFEMPQGTLYIKSHPLLNTHSLYKNSMFVIDPTNMKYRYMRDTTFKDNIQNNDEDNVKGQWLTECGLEVNHEETFAYLGNFTNP